jgi:acyl-[acyl-carrier-protein]-phospholipid O-acyltransferase/long-chain-fatty-acid--[acyl-carrier-protein] ligase
MTRNQLDLLRSRRFLPLFITQALGAFNDNLFKSAIIFLVTFVMAERSGLNAPLLVAAAGGIFIFPFFLFSANAGQLAEKYDKARLIRLLKLTELGLMLTAAAGLLLGSVWFLMAVLFLMGAQSAYFGPIKYGILPEQLKSEELIGGNAWVQSGTFVAILLGTLFGKLVLDEEGVYIISALVVGMAALGWLASRFIPSTDAMAPRLQVDYNVFTSTWEIMRYAAGRRDIFLTILGISWFWLVGATFLAQITPFAKEVLGCDENLASLFLMLFSVGMALGSLLCNSMLKGEVHATFVPLGALALSIFIIDLYFASRHGLGSGAGLVGISAFLENFTGWRISLDILLIAIAGGVYIVPLNTLVQHRSKPGHRARNIAANNIFNALFMVLSALGTALLLSLDLSIPQIFLVVALLNLAVAVYITRLLPGALVRAIIAWLLQMFYRVEVTGLKHLREAGERVLIVANHQSFLDPALIAAYVPEDLTFAIDTFVAKNRMLKYFLSLARTIPIDPTNPLSTRALIEAVRRGEKVVIFPEGRITVTGSLMKVFEGPGMVADKAGARIVPVRLEGAQYSPFSRLRGQVRIRWFPRMRVAFQPPQELSIPTRLRSRERRTYAGRLLSDLMTGMMFESSDYRRTLFHSLLDAKEIHGAGHRVLEDVERKPASYRRTLIGSFALGRAMAAQTTPGEHVGLLLPNAVATVLAFFGLQAHGRVPAMLNFSTGTRALLGSCHAAEVRTVYSSRRFIELGKLQELVAAIEAEGMRLLYLEDLKQGMGAGAKLLALASALAPRLAYRFSCRNRDPESPAVILFTSGTEGSPKGVVLSHTNLQANRYQVSSMIDFGPGDTVFNVLPLFHSFGLTCGTLLPILSGLKIFLYPSPLHYRIVPEMVYDTNATLMFGTDTFLAGYARFANPYDFYSIRYVFTGAERLRDETRKVWSDRYGVRIFEGYGTTETAPVLSMNSPMYNLRGSVGRLAPGIEHRLEPVPGIAAGGRLWIRGPNVMSGYLRAEQPGRLQPPAGGWYDTGDIVGIDAGGFVTIQGRAKRFAKIGGEMVSLTAVEGMAAGVWPDHRHAVVNLPDPKKGERLVLATDNPDADRDTLAAFAREQGIAAINLPAQVLVVAEIPVLGSGKTDYRGVMKLVENRDE